MTDVACFMLTETNRCKRWLRRFDGSTPCPLMPGQYSYHDACVPGEDGVILRGSEDTIACEQFRHADPRWPTHCPCGHAFPDAAERQTFFLQVWLTPDGKECSIHESPPAGIEQAPAGAMYYADWFSWKGPDGRSLALVTPGGVWLIDGPASNGGNPWTRTGTPPVVTASPSIHIVGRYHGWLRDGRLIEC